MVIETSTENQYCINRTFLSKEAKKGPRKIIKSRIRYSLMRYWRKKIYFGI
jgi:hypothetical protein